MARQKPPSKAGAFWRAINVREDLAHDSAQGFVLERSAAARSEELCPLEGQASLWREAAAEQALLGTAVSLFAWRAIRKRRRTSRAAARRDSCSSGARSAE